MACSVESEEGGEQIEMGTGMSPFDLVKSIFTDTPSAKRQKHFKLKVRKESDSEADGSGDERMEEEDQDEEVSFKKSKGNRPQSSIHVKASDTKIINPEFYAHEMLDGDETDGRDFTFNELPFNLLVAGELEVILGDVSAEEKWTHLSMLKRLAYRAQILDIQSIRDRYASFLHKFEKGKMKWGSEAALRDLDEMLRLSAFMSLRKQAFKVSSSSKVGVASKEKGGGRSDVNVNVNRKFYCADFNKGTCTFDASHEGTFNCRVVWKLHMCRSCWEKEGVERSHPAGHRDCPQGEVLTLSTGSEYGVSWGHYSNYSS